MAKRCSPSVGFPESTEAERKTFDEGHESMKNGWTGTLDRLTEYLAGIKAKY